MWRIRMRRPNGDLMYEQFVPTDSSFSLGEGELMQRSKAEKWSLEIEEMPEEEKE